MIFRVFSAMLAGRDPGLPLMASDSGATSADGGSTESRPRRGCRRFLVAALLVLLAGGGALLWRATRPTVDTTPPKAVLEKVEPNKPLFDEGERQVTFVLHDQEGRIPTFFIFEDPDQKGTAVGINTIRGTPNEQGVEIRFEAIRFLLDEYDPDTLWVRAVGIVNEMEGKTPVSRQALEGGEPLDLHFHDEINVPYVAHVTYGIDMTVQYDARTQRLTLTKSSGSMRWKMLGTESFDEGTLDMEITGRKGHYPEKPLLTFQ
jgi:hypothetical protein